MKTLLVPLLSIPEDRQTILNALELARMLPAHVTAMFPGGYLSEFLSETEPRPSALKPWLQTEARAALAQQIETVRADFDDLVRSQKLTVSEQPGHEASVHFEIRRGIPERAIQEAAIYHDAIVLSHSGDSANSSFQKSLIKSALAHAAKPVWMLPERIPVPFGAHAAIAWNGSAPSARAVSAALPWLHRADAVHVLTVATSKTSHGAADDLRRYLEWHGIQSAIRKLERSGLSVGADLLHAAQDVEADFLVLGAYTHSRTRETLLGGVTEVVVNNATIPVLFAK